VSAASTLISFRHWQENWPVPVPAAALRQKGATKAIPSLLNQTSDGKLSQHQCGSQFGERLQAADSAV